MTVAPAARAALGFPGLLEDDSPPTVAGAIVVGATLSGLTGEWSGRGPIAYVDQWQRCTSSCAAVPGATAATYTVTTADQGARLRLLVTAANSAATVTAPSAPTEVVGPPPTAVQSALMAALAPVGRTRDVALALQTLGYPLTLNAPAAGRLTVTWYRGSHPAAPASGVGLTRVASGAATVRTPGPATVSLRLTKAGRTLLRHARTLTVTAVATLAAAQSATVTAVQVFQLR